MAILLRVLLIDSTDAGAASLLEELRRGGYEPSCCRVADAAELAVALVQEWGIALCNWHLPGFNGAQALEMMRARDVDLPIIVFSSDSRRDGAMEAIKAGADNFVGTHEAMRLIPVVERALREAEIRRARHRAEKALRESG